jgi:hypothetical protein
MSDHWGIAPYVGVGPLKFGMSRARARSQFEGVPMTFRQGPYAIGETDAYGDLGLHLYYDSEDLLRCIMAFESGPIHFKNVVLLNRPLQEILDALATLGLTSRYDDEGYWLDEAGFVLHAPDGVIKAVTVYRRGYYEEEVALALKVVPPLPPENSIQ